MGRRARSALLALTASAVAACVAATPDETKGTSGQSLVRAQYAPSPNVLTQHGDSARTGAQLLETTLSPSTVRVDNFGKLATRNVDGQIYAQPLYVQNVTIKGVARNVVYVATMKNNVYAFDADDTSPGAAPLWWNNYGAPFDLASDHAFDGCVDVSGSDGRIVGMTSTPVIDAATGTMYVVEKLANSGPAGAAFVILALDIATGGAKNAVLIDGAVAGNGAGSVRTSTDPHDHRTRIQFQPKLQHQRASLLLSNGTLYIGFGAHCDRGPYHGWLMAYDASTLVQRAIFNTTPYQVAGQTADGEQGGIWQSGQGPAADDAGNVYIMTGNGSWNGTTNFGDSFVKLSLAPQYLYGFAVSSWFTPHAQGVMYTTDQDLGSAGAMLLPGTNQIIGGGKTGALYVLDRTTLGGMTSDDSGALDAFPGATGGNIHGSPIVWKGSDATRVYVWSENDELEAFKITPSGKLDRAPERSNVTLTALDGGEAMPGGFLTLSANGSTAGSGIVWASYPTINANQHPSPGILYAFDATHVSSPPLWSSQMYRSGVDNSVGTFAKFVAPTVANGKVYMAAWSLDDPNGNYGRLHIYGILPCRAKSCAELGACGTIDDGCGDALHCGACRTGQICHLNRCVSDPCSGLTGVDLTCCRNPHAPICRQLQTK
jgi:hypothetical protein